MRLIVGELMVASGRLWRPIASVVRWAISGLLLAGGLHVTAQESDATDQTNDLAVAEALARISEMVQAAESGQLEDMPGAEDSTATNGASNRSAPAPGTNRLQSSSRSQNDDRRSRGRRSSRSKPEPGSSSRPTSDSNRGGDRMPGSAPAGTNGSSAGLDYAAFKVIVDRNIFDPNRYPHRAGEPRARPVPKTVDSVTLVGTMSYEKGWFAFFDGSSAPYQKALKLTDTIAGYKVTEIAPNSVRLAAGTNALELKVGMQMRREEDGPWLLAGQSGASTPASISTSSNTVTAAAANGADAAVGVAESEVIKRLMQKRLQE